MTRIASRALVPLALAVALQVGARGETVSVVGPDGASPRVAFGAEKVAKALRDAGLDAQVVHAAKGPGRKVYLNQPRDASLGREGFLITNHRDNEFQVQDGSKSGTTFAATRNEVTVVGGDDSGVLYGCLELAARIRAEGKLPAITNLAGKPAMTLRGTCVGLQKTYILPGRRVYEYPYTPELFPWFYDRALWTEYLDFLVANRLNTLYLWNGHPFASLVRLADYPDAVEVPDEVFRNNVSTFRWLAGECDRRGIWLVQMFYNIFLPKPLAEKHGVSTQLAASTPLAADYTRKAIAEFVREYPNVGLMVCLGEALQGTANQLAWATNTILPGVLDGMKAAGLKEQPPVVFRTHAMDPEVIMPACFQVYSNLFTETKYNGESLTTYEPRGKAQATHLAMAKLGPHLVNVHILSNLEPFRFGAQRFIKKSVQASRERLGASGLHLYPLAYWNWPFSPDAVEPPLKQWERDWIWFEAWARYAWNPGIPEAEDRAYWVGRLTERYGNAAAAALILDAYNDAGEVAPMLVRRFGITEGNRQTLSLGMTLDQLVNPKKYGAIEELWLSQAPPGERLDEFARKEWSKAPHQGETPVSVEQAVSRFSRDAERDITQAAPLVTRNRAEFERLLNDIRCIRVMADGFYVNKSQSAQAVLRYGYSRDIRDLEEAARLLELSLRSFEELAKLTGKTYRFANSMQTGHRKIPFPGAAGGAGTNYHWTQVLPLYQNELREFQAKLAALRNPSSQPTATEAGVRIKAWPGAKFTLFGTNAEAYRVEAGARPFADRKYTITRLAPELNGLTGIRFSHEAAKTGRNVPIEFEVAEPVRVLVGYFQDDRDIWLQPPNLDVASHADERGGVDVLLRDAAVIEECPVVDIHAFRYEPGHHKLELIGKGSFVVLGVVPQSIQLEKRDAGLRPGS